MSPAATCLIRWLAGVQYDSSTTETTVANFVLSNPNVRNLDFLRTCLALKILCGFGPKFGFILDLSEKFPNVKIYFVTQKMLELFNT